MPCNSTTHTAQRSVEGGSAEACGSGSRSAMAVSDGSVGMRLTWSAVVECRSNALSGTGPANGAQVIHGVLPVRAGRPRKFVTDLTDAPGA
ncbi:hypothetical protein ACH427_29550 [Streptomyces sp. NPDC020379]|uniref:hypothetical protein n=1 Tax=Streptomyces sp. NPDC020379 TaxID=3365071 RepID=UPI0037B129B5